MVVAMVEVDLEVVAVLDSGMEKAVGWVDEEAVEEMVEVEAVVEMEVEDWEVKAEGAGEVVS